MEIKVKNFQTPVLSSDMSIHPEAYLLTREEDDCIGEAYGLLAQTSLSFYSAVNDKRLQDEELLKKIAQEEVFTLYEKKGIDINRILKICAKAEACKWWSLIIADVLTVTDDDDGKNRIVLAFDLLSNDAGIKKRRIRTDKHAALFDTEDVKRQAKMLKIPEGVLYMSMAQLHATNLLRNICRIYEGSAIDVEALDKQGFWLIPNNPVANAFYSIGSSALKNKAVKMDYDENGMQIATCSITGTTGAVISIADDGHTDLLFKSNNVDMMYTLLMKKALVSHSKSFSFTLDEFMEARGLSDRKEANKKVKSALSALNKAEISLAYNGKNVKGTGKRKILQGLDDIEDKRKGRKIAYHVIFSDFIYDEVIMGKGDGALSRMRGYELLPEEIQKIRNPHAYRFARLFSSHLRHNVGSNTSNPCVLSVQTLLNNCSLPLYDDLKDKGHVGQLIIRKFIEAMESLVKCGIFTEYIFQHKKDGDNNLQLTDDELERLENDYALFSSLNVQVTWALQPDYSKLADKKQKRIEQAAAPKRKRGRPRKV